MIETRKIIVQGKVQGVFYRVHARDLALLIGLTGFVMNNPDGSVYIEASGTSQELDTLIRWCHKGPPKANVTGVVAEVIDYKEFEGFEIRK